MPVAKKPTATKKKATRKATEPEELAKIDWYLSSKASLGRKITNLDCTGLSYARKDKVDRDTLYPISVAKFLLRSNDKDIEDLISEGCPVIHNETPDKETNRRKGTFVYLPLLFRYLKRRRLAAQEKPRSASRTFCKDACDIKTDEEFDHMLKETGLRPDQYGKYHLKRIITWRKHKDGRYRSAGDVEADLKTRKLKAEIRKQEALANKAEDKYILRSEYEKNLVTIAKKFRIMWQHIVNKNLVEFENKAHEELQVLFDELGRELSRSFVPNPVDIEGKKRKIDTVQGYDEDPI